MFFFAATFITQITMLNMLIAIMADTFDRIADNKLVNAIRSKLELIGDLVAVLDAEDKIQSKNKFFFLVQPEDGEDEEEDDEVWEGTIRALTRTVERKS